VDAQVAALSCQKKKVEEGWPQCLVGFEQDGSTKTMLARNFLYLQDPEACRSNTHLYSYTSISSTPTFAAAAAAVGPAPPARSLANHVLSHSISKWF
jgi:hypothetical protein